MSCQGTEQIDCDIINEIVTNDQFFRKKHMDITSPFFFTLDTLLKADGYTNGIDELSSYDSDMVAQKRELARDIVDSRPEASRHILDSIWALQSQLDESNTLRMIEIVEKFGLHSLDTLRDGCALDGFIVFVHSPDHLKARIKKLIDPGLIEIDEYKHRHIMWHVNGRE